MNIDDFQILGTIGQGASGTILVAIHTTNNNNRVALKRLEIVVEPRDYNEFLNELTILNAFQNIHVINYFGYFLHNTEENHFLYLVLEFAPYGSLDLIIENNFQVLPFRLRLAWIKDITKGLISVHQNEIIHNDIKPANCLVFNNNAIKLSDFGLSRTFQSASTNNQNGTLAYAAPEILDRAQNISVQSDIFSLGKTIYHIFILEIPNIHDSINNLRQRITEYINNEIQNNPHIQEFLSLLLQCLDIVPTNRPSLNAFFNSIITLENYLGGDIRQFEIELEFHEIEIGNNGNQVSINIIQN